MSKIKVLEFEITENMGGVESLLCNIDEEIDKEKFQIDYVANNKADYQNKLKKLGSKIYFLPAPRNLIQYKKSINNILDNGYDIVHFNKNSLANSFPIIYAKQHHTHPKIILHSHNTAPTHNIVGLKFLHNINKKILKNKVDYRIACSIEAKKWMFNPNESVEIINNGIDTNKFRFSVEKRQKIRQKLNINKTDLVIGNVGRFNRQKNHTELINIYNELLKEMPNSKLILIGEGEEKNKIINFIREKGLEKNVILVGTTSKVDEYLSAMDIFLMPSLYEGLPIAAVEAQASGLNVFVSDNISAEVYITSYIHPISLLDPSQKNAKCIKNKYKVLDTLERQKQADVVKNKGFDLKNTTLRIEEIYEMLTTRE